MKKLILILTLITGFSSVHAGGLDGGATEFTQILNNGQLVLQLEQEAKQVANQIQDLAKLSDGDLLKYADKLAAKTSLNKLVTLYKQGQNIAQAGKNLKKKYKELGNISLSDAINNANFPSLFAKWSTQNHDTVKGILKQNNIQLEWFKDQQTEMTTINDMLNSSEGTVSILQAGAKIANAQVDSLNQLSQLQISQNNLIASEVATKQSKDNAEQARLLKDSGVGEVKLNDDDSSIFDLIKQHNFK